MSNHEPSRESANQAAAFAALEAIMSGAWDRYLHRFKGAVTTRSNTDEYQNSIIAGRPLVDGEQTNE